MSASASACGRIASRSSVMSSNIEGRRSASTNGSAVSARLAGRLSPARTVGVSVATMLAAAACNVAVSTLLSPGLPQSVLPIMLHTFGMAIGLPCLTLLALDHFPEHRGLASSCQSFLQMLVSAVCAGVAAPALWGSVHELAVGSAGSLLLTHSWDGQIPALKDFPAGDRPNSTIVFWTFRAMVGLGTLMIVLALAGLCLRRGGRVCPPSRPHGQCGGRTCGCQC